MVLGEPVFVYPALGFTRPYLVSRIMPRYDRS
jgi:hypothetical protein